MPTLRHATHATVPPLVNDNCHTLVLGTMLSPKSVEEQFYYAHPQNRFWRTLAEVFAYPYPVSVDEKRKLALDNGIALWDVLQSCDILGAADGTIKNPICNDVVNFLSEHRNITRIFTTGKKAAELLKKYNATHGNHIIANAVCLPSPSPLNCAIKLDELIKSYSVLKIRPNA